MTYTQVNDSGAREAFNTGSVRDTREGKGRFDLISPIALERLAKHYENGAKKYGDRNWEKGQPVSRFMDSALRHLNKHNAGMRDEDHLSAAVWNIMGIMHVMEMIERGNLPKELDDSVSFAGVPEAFVEPQKFRWIRGGRRDERRWWGVQTDDGPKVMYQSDVDIKPFITEGYTVAQFNRHIQDGDMVRA